MSAQPTTQLISVEEYLRTSYSPECEYLDGLLLEKPMPIYEHSRLQAAISTIFMLHELEWQVRVCPEQRTQINPTRVRVPDLVIVPDDYDRSPVVHNPLLAIEILSPSDTVREMEERWREALSAGAKQVWIIDPKGSIFIADHSGLHQIPSDTHELTLNLIRFDLDEMWKLAKR